MSTLSKLGNTTLKGASIAAGSALAAVAGWWLYSKLGINHRMALPQAINAERSDFHMRNGLRLSYYSDTRASGTPLVLIHSVNAAASAFEMKKLFEHYRGKRPVYALDLPGFGFSERADISYTPDLFTKAVLEFLQTQVSKAADVIALSLGSEFAARAALTAPTIFNSLTLISPTGLNFKRDARASDKAGKTGGNDTFYRIASNPLWAKAFYDIIATPASIQYFLKDSFVGDVPEDLKTYSYLSSHQMGAEHAPLHFISGKLFTPTIEKVYERLSVPTFIIFDQDAFVSFEKLPDLLEANPNVQALRLTPSKGLPQFEMPARTAEALDGFWQQPHSEYAEVKFPSQ